jgi:hypothetical protein
MVSAWVRVSGWFSEKKILSPHHPSISVPWWLLVLSGLLRKDLTQSLSAATFGHFSPAKYVELNGLIIHLIPTSLLFVFTLLFASVCFLSVKDLINGICIYICLFMFHIYFLFSLEMEHNFKQHNGCVTLWPCHLH